MSSSSTTSRPTPTSYGSPRGREESHLVLVDGAGSARDVPGLLPWWLAGDLPQRWSPFFISRREIRPAWRGQQPALGLPHSRGRRAIRGRQVLRQDPQDSLSAPEDAAPALGR